MGLKILGMTVVFKQTQKGLMVSVEDDNNKDWTALRLGQPFLYLRQNKNVYCLMIGMTT